jgi:hypothetical protein
MEPVVGRLQVAQQAAQFHDGTLTGAARHIIEIVTANVDRLVAGLSRLGGA